MSEESAAPTQTITTAVDTSSSFNIPNVAPVAETSGGRAAPTDTPTGPALADIVPAEYKDKPYMSKINDVDGLFKSFDSAQEMLGKRPAGIPHEDAGEEAWNSFYKELGRPDTPDGYDVKLPELPEGMQADDAQLKGFKETAHKLGLTPKQTQALVDYDVERQKAMMGKMQEQSAASQKQLDDEFDELSAKTFGERADEAIKNSRKLISQYVPKDFQDKIQNLDNNSLIVLTSVLDGVTRDYISEDQPLRGDSPAAQTTEERLAEAHRLLASDANRNAFHVDHDATVKKIQSIYQDLYGGK